MGWYEDWTAEIDSQKAPLDPQPTKPAADASLGWFENFRRRAHLANQGQVEKAFSFDKDPEAIPAEADASWFGKWGQASKAGLNTLGGLQEVTTTYPLRKAFGVSDDSDLRLSDFAQNNPILNFSGAARDVISGGKENDSLAAAIKLAQAGDNEGAQKLLAARRTGGGLTGGVARAASEFLADPTMPLSFGKKIGLTILPALVEGGVKAPLQWIQRAQKEGVTQELLAELPQTAVASVMAAMGVQGQRQAWSPKVAAAAREAKAQKAAEASAEEQKLLAPVTMNQFPGLKSPKTIEELQGLAERERPVDTGVLNPEIDYTLHETFTEVLGMANEAVSARQDPMLRADGVTPQLPREIRFADGETLPDGTPIPPGAKASTDSNGIIWITPYGRAWTLQAPDAASVARKASELIAHEVSHPAQDAGRPTGMQNPITGEPVGPSNAETGHARGARVVDDRLGDLNMLQGEYALRRQLAADPRLAGVAQYIDSTGRLNSLYGPEGLESATQGSYSPETLSLAHELGLLGEGVEAPYGFLEAGTDAAGPSISAVATAPHRLTPDLQGPQIFRKPGPLGVATNKYSGASKRPTAAQQLASVWSKPQDPRLQAALEAEKLRQIRSASAEADKVLLASLAKQQPNGPEARQLAADEAAAAAKMTPPPPSILGGIKSKWMSLIRGVQPKPEEKPLLEDNSPEAAQARIALRQALGQSLRGQTKGNPVYTGEGAMAKVQEWADNFRSGRWTEGNQAAMEGQGIPSGAIREYWQGYYNMLTKHRAQHGADAPLSKELQRHKANLDVLRQRAPRASGTSPRQLGTSPRGQRGRVIAAASETTSKERTKVAQERGAESAEDVRKANREYQQERAFRERKLKQDRQTAALAQVRRVQQALNRAAANRVEPIKGDLRKYLDAIEKEGLENLSPEQRRAYEDARRQSAAAEQMTPPPKGKDISDEEAAAIIAERDKPKEGWEQDPSPERVAEEMAKAEAADKAKAAPPKQTATSFFGKLGKPPSKKKWSGASKRKSARQVLEDNDAPVVEPVAPKNPAAERFFNRIKGLSTWAEKKAAKGAGNVFAQRPRTTASGVKSMMARKKSRPLPSKPPAPPRTQAGPKGQPPADWPFAGRLEEGKTPEPFDAEGLRSELAARTQDQQADSYLPTKEAAVDTPAKQRTSGLKKFFSSLDTKRSTKIQDTFKKSMQLPTVHDAVQFINDELGYGGKGQFTINDLQDFAGALNAAGITDFKDAKPWAVDLAKVGSGRASLRPGKPEDFTEKMSRTLTDLEMKRQKAGETKPELEGFYKIKNLPIGTGGRKAALTKVTEAITTSESPASRRSAFSEDEQAHRRLFGNEEETVNGIVTAEASGGLVGAKQRLTLDEIEAARFSPATRARLETAFKRLLAQYRDGTLYSKPVARYKEDGTRVMVTLTPEERAVQALRQISRKLVSQGAVTAKKPGARLTTNLGLKGGAATPFSGFRALQDLSSRLAKGVRLGALRALGIRAASGTVPHPSATWKPQKYRRWKLTEEGKRASGEVEFQEPLKGKSQVLADVQEVLGVRFSPEQAEAFWLKYNQGSAAAGGKRQLYSVLEAVQAYREHLKNTLGFFKDVQKWFKNPDYKKGPKGEITTGVKRIDAALAQRRRYDRFAELTQDPKNKRAHKLLAYEVSLLVKKADPSFARQLVESPEKFSRQKLLGLLPKGYSIDQIMLTAEKVKPQNIQKALDNASAALNQAGVDIDAGYITEVKYNEVRNLLGTRSMEKDLVSVFTKLVQADGFEYPELQAAGGKVGRGTIPDSLNLLGKKRAFPTGGRKGGKAPTFDEEALGAAAVEKGVTRGAAAQEEAATTPISRVDQLTEEEAAAAEKMKPLEAEKDEAPAVKVGELSKSEAAKLGMTGLKGLDKDLKDLSTTKTSKVGMTKYQGAKKPKKSKLRGLVEQTPGFYTARLPRWNAEAAQKEPGRMAAFDEEQAKSQPLEGYDMSPEASALAEKVDVEKIVPGSLGKYALDLVSRGKLLDADVPGFIDRIAARKRGLEEAAAKGVRTSDKTKGSISYKPSIAAIRKEAGAEPFTPKASTKKGAKPLSPPPGYKWSGASKRRRAFDPMPGVPKTLETIANTPKSQLPKDTAASIKAQKTWATVGGWLNLPRPLLTAADVSGVFRQTWQLTSDQLVRDLSQLATGKVDDTSFLKNTWRMLKSFADEDFYQGMKKELEADSWYKAGKEVGLRFVSDEHPNEAWVGKEKLNKALEKMKIFEPVSGIINASNRAFNYYQNKVMRDGFKHYIEATEAYHALKKDPKGLTNDEIQDAVTHINNAASRSVVSKNPEINERLNYVFYSAQMNVSRIRMLTNSVTGFAKYSTPASRHVARMQTLRAIAGAAAMTGAVYAFGKLRGEEPEIETSMISTDFGKVRFGNITFDGWGGNQQFLRAAAQAWTGKQKERSTGLPKDRKLGDVLVSFVRSKLGPGASTIWNIADERNLSGETTDISFDSADPVTGAWNLTKDLVMPMSVADTIDLWKENPRLAWLLPLMLMGEGMGAGGGAKERWLEDRSWTEIAKGAPSARRAKDNQNSKEMRKFGITPPRLGSKVTLPGRDKYGRKNYYNLSLSEKQEFEAQYMPLVTDLLNEMINSDTYRKLPDDRKRKKLFRYVHRLNVKYGAARRAKKMLRAKYRAGELPPSNRQPVEDDE